MAKKAMSVKKSLAIFVPCITAAVAIMLALIIAASMFWQDISLWLYGRAQKTDAAVLEGGTELCEDIVEEGIVLLKNEKDDKGNAALPLTDQELDKGVNVFGWAGYDWMTMAFGSGYANTDLQKVKLFPALEAAGIKYNEDLYNLYKDYYTAHVKIYGEQDYWEYRGGVKFGSEEIFVLREPSYNDYLAAAVKSDVIESGVGIVVIGRTGSESKDLSASEQVRQTEAGKNIKKTFNDRHYLQLSPDEENMIKAATELCDKVIVVLNTANTMETGFIESEEIDGALLVGITGISGVNGLVNVLRGEKEEPVPELDSDGNVKYNADGTPVYKKDANGNVVTEKKLVSPSGRTVDTYAYDIIGTTPSAVNQGNKGNGEVGAGTIYANRKNEKDSRFKAYVDYSEGIYVGYKWFETADAEGYWADVDNQYGKGYNGVVQYPFGYGLSYADFEWEITDVSVPSGSELKVNDKIEITVKVKNNSKTYPGADVVQLYYTPQYIKGGIEKAFVNLADFAKTDVIQPGGFDVVTLSVSAQGMASYDCYDKNNNGHTGYELDGGDYQLRLMKNSHEAADMAKGSSVLDYTVPAKGYTYDKDEQTGNEVINRFTNKDGKNNDQTIDEADLDGSHESDGGVKYLSREDFKATYPKKITNARDMTDEALQIAKMVSPTQKQLEYAGYTDAEGGLGTKRDVSAGGNGLKLADAMDAKSYDDEIWKLLISNITNSELAGLVSDGYFKTNAIPSIDKKEFVDLDGPLGFNTRVTGGEGTSCEFVAYPSGTMLAQTWSTNLAVALGRSVGREKDSIDGLYGWYAPGANTHRNPFGGRNGEYYSEDGVLAGKICAGTVSGAKDMGVYSYVKHFVVNDTEYNREGLFTFLTEQTLREVYLKPFEIMIKEGGGNALMTSMNRLGRVWSGGNYGVMTEIVRNEWNFRGSAVTDWMNSGESYMPPYRGIWAGNSIWLTNGFTDSVFNTIKNDMGYKVAERVAHDVLWTFVDTQKAAKNFDPSLQIDLNKGAQYNLAWVAGVVVVEVALLAGVAVMAFFLAKNIIKNKKAANSASADEAEPAETTKDGQ